MTTVDDVLREYGNIAERLADRLVFWRRVALFAIGGNVGFFLGLIWDLFA